MDSVPNMAQTACRAGWRDLDRRYAGTSPPMRGAATPPVAKEVAAVPLIVTAIA